MLKCFSASFASTNCKVGRTVIIAFLAIFLYSCDDQERKDSDHIVYVDNIREEASRMMDKGETTRALAFFDSAYQAIENPGTGDEIRKFTFKGQNYYKKLKDYNSAITQMDSIFLLLSNEDLKKEYIRDYSTALFQKGDLLFEMRRFNDAYQYYYRGKLIAQTILDPCAVSEYTYRLGMVSFKQSKFNESINNFKQCFEHSAYCIKDFPNFALRQELLSNIALSYGKLGMIDSSLNYSYKALAFIAEGSTEYPDRKDYVDMARAVVFGNQSEQYYKKGDTLTAISLLQKSIETNTRKGFDLPDAQIAMAKLGEIYVDSDMLYEACEIGERLKVSLDTSYNLFVDIGFNKLNWKYNDKLQKPDEAYVYLQKYIRLKDSLDLMNKKLVSADVDREFENIEQQYNYSLLSKANDLKKGYLYIALIFAVMALVILLLIWYNWRNTKSNIAALTKLNKQIIFQNTQLGQTLDDLRQSNSDKDKILKIVAHDLRNPLGAIVSISSLLLDENNFTEEQRELGKMLKTLGLQSVDMISDLLAANLSYRAEEMKMESIDVSALVQECLEQLKFKADEKDQKLELEIWNDVKIMGDREKLSRVLSNLVVNAIKFSDLKATVKVKMQVKDEKLELAILDQGIGIPDNLKDKIFDPFTEAKRAGTSGEQPFGLGLSISRQIVEAHGGSIWFESQENQGTTFYIALPLVLDRPDVEEKSAQKELT
ncbi:HAMP domain-containing histidine kinase [Dyadobacter sp. CY345]|uniref:tetratricopeptide repeat-containing sensor histidine kinase n=1 Tax=Dyadobacter sp. CY345 TaxID=2909335 RepID=UPI001F2D3B9D|nr:HAMP domain-containing sensor histidine kinase [Dyadobacter sp. CY345]MCF2444354.1 HAMP domain-containing histidine kinase [Dyadobacter sp. CY345]